LSSFRAPTVSDDGDFGVRRHDAAFMVGNKLPTNIAEMKARACNGCA
jgi:hypothetical protein